MLVSAFLIVFSTYLLLILAEVLQPGFVSNYVSAHWLLLLALILFGGLVHRGERLVVRPLAGVGVTLVVAMIAGVVTWRLGAPLQELRPFLAFIAFFLPIAIVKCLSSDL